MALFIEDSDQDSIATDTTEESVHSEDHSYRVETVLAETLDKEGIKKYLVKWEGYALHRASWEPRASFDTEDEINDFKARKRAAEKGESPLFDTLEYDEALDIAKQDKENKAQRRRTKRENRRQRRESESQASTKAIGAGSPASRKTSQASPVRKKGIVQKVVKKPKAAKPFRPTNVESAPTARAPKAAKATRTAEPAKTPAQANITESAETVEQRMSTEPRTVAKPTPIAKPAGAAEPASIPRPVTTSGTAKVTPNASSTKPTQPARETTPSKPLLGSDVPEYKRRQKARITEKTPKHSTAPKFRTLSEQNRYQKYSRNEPAPNINAVPLLDPSTGKALPDDLQPALARNDSAYGRRTPPLERRQRSPSPPVVLPENHAQANPPSNDPKRTRTPCKFFQSGTCRYTADTCHFSHTYPRSQEPNKIYTCHYWKRGNGCWKSAEQCEFAHHDTRVVVPGPSQQTCFYWRMYGKCSKTQEQCKFAHSDTGLYAPAPPGHVDKGPPAASGFVDRGPQIGPDMGISSIRHPEGPAPRHTQSAASNDLFPFPSGSPSEFFRVPVENSTAAQSDTASPSVPELHPDIHMQYNRSIHKDLELARKSIQDLSAAKFLSKNGRRIENVYLLMPPERDGERELLTDLFKALKCEVFDSRTPQHWEFFKSFNPALLVVHPTEEFDGTLPGLAKYLQHSKGWMCSIGIHEDWDHVEQDQPTLKYEARRIFPHGGITFISDDIFEYYPEKATEMIKEFNQSSKRKPPGSETSKIGARPGVRDWLARLAQRKMEDGGEGYEDDRYVNCWDAICDLCPLEDYDPYEMEMGNMVPKDDALLWSIAEQDLPSFQGLWEKDQAKATDMMANLFAGTGVERMADFQRFCFVYQRPDQAAMSDEIPASQLAPQVVMGHVDPHGWMQKYNHIEVMTPDAWLAMTRKRAEQGQSQGVR